MRLIGVVFRNLRRRLGRKVLLIAGLSIGVATVVALLAITATMQLDVATKLDEYGANILIVPRSNDLSLSYGGVNVASASFDVSALTLADLDRIKTIKNYRNISVVAPKVLGAYDVQDVPILVAGVRFEDELRLKRWWTIEGEGPTSGSEALVGKRLSEALDLGPGSEVDLEGQSFLVTGVLEENGSQDDDIMFIDLAAAQEIMNKPEAISLVEISALCIACPVEEMVKQITEVLPHARVSALRQAVTLRMETIGQLSRFALAISAVVLIIGGMVVMTTMLGAVQERRQEIGLFRALGFRQQHVMRIILIEAGVVSLLGGGIGWLAGMIIAGILAPRVMDVTTPVSWSPQLAVGAICGALLVGLVASLYPASRAARLDPTTALRAL